MAKLYICSFAGNKCASQTCINCVPVTSRRFKGEVKGVNVYCSASTLYPDKILYVEKTVTSEII